MATVLEEAYKLFPNTQALVAAMRMPTGATATGVEAYNPVGYSSFAAGTGQQIRLKSPEEVANAARQIVSMQTEAQAANPYAGRIFGSTPERAQQLVLQKRQQDLDFTLRQAQLAEQARQFNIGSAARQNQLASTTPYQQAQLQRQQQNDILDYVAQMSGVDARRYGVDARYGGATPAAGVAAAFSGGAAPARTVRSSANRVDPFATTVADNLYDRLESLQMEQQSAEAPFMRELTDAAAAVTQLTGEIPQYEDGIPSFGGAEAQQLFASRRFGTGDSMSSIGQALAEINANRSAYGGLAKLSQTNIDRAKASGRLGLPVPAARGTPLSPLAALLLRQPGTAGPGGTIQYSPEQVSAARSALGWRGAYGGPGVSAYGTTPLEQARAEEARRQATMRDPASWTPSRGPAVPPSASPAPTPTLASGDYRLVPRSSGIEAAAVNPLGASALGLSSILSTMLGGRRPVDAGTQAEIEQRRLAGEFPSTTAYIERYPQWLRSLLAAPGEITPPSSAAPAPLVPSGGRTTSWPGPAYVEPTVNPGILDLLAGRTPETATMSPAQRVAAMLGIAF